MNACCRTLLRGPRPGPLLLGTLVVLALSFTRPAEARNIEPGEFRLEAGVGPGLNLGFSRLGATGEYLFLDAAGLYYFGSVVGIVAEFGVGVSGGTVPLRWRAGARFHLPNLNLPISPYLQAQLSVSHLLDVLGADLTAIGVRLAAGMDYPLTYHWGLGVLTAVDLSGTVSSRAELYGTFEGVLYARYTF